MFNNISENLKYPKYCLLPCLDIQVKKKMSFLCVLFIVIVVRYALPELRIHSSCLKRENMCWSIKVIMLVACLRFILTYIFSIFSSFFEKKTYCCRTRCLSVRPSSVEILSFCSISLSKMSPIQTMLKVLDSNFSFYF